MSKRPDRIEAVAHETRADLRDAEDRIEKLESKPAQQPSPPLSLALTFRQLTHPPIRYRINAADVDRGALKAFDDDAVAGF